MLLALKQLSDGDARKLMDLYREGNEETAPECRRQGFAARPLTEAMELWRGQGISAVRGSVSKRNLPSIATHRKCGFEIEREDAVSALDGETNPKCYGMVCRLN